MCKAVLIATAAVAFGLAACSKNSPGDARAATTTPTAQPVAAPAAADDNTPPPGVDLSALDEFERKVFFRVVNKEPSACGKAHSLIHSLKNDPEIGRAHV